jgi:adenosylcobinamide kinase/adenosylcobinamide-phosphate guanylyltransferase
MSGVGGATRVAGPLVLVLGGNRSGKSRFALALAQQSRPSAPVAYLATASPGDPELDARIARHRAERPAAWPTIDVGRDLPAALARVEPDMPILLDGLTLWIAACMGDTEPVDIDGLLDGPVAAGLAALAEHPSMVIVVSDEVGGGLVPMHPGARAFRDLVGFAHQRLAAMADEVHLLTAGIPLALKGPDRR